MFAIGPYKLTSPTLLAPMAGVSDLPFRQLCRRMGAGLAVGEMVNSNPALYTSRKTRQRLDHRGESGPVAVQIVGSDPQTMAEAARYNAGHGADIIDINMGCPAKKVCKKAAGSALLRDERLVREILEAVVAAVEVPVTLKIRTGWDPDSRNAPRIGLMAESIGIQALTIHGRTRQCRFAGSAEYDTIARVVDNLTIPVIANGDICDPQQARKVLRNTGAAGVMIGRGAQGNPWIFEATNRLLGKGEESPPPTLEELSAVMLEHLQALHSFYGTVQGVGIARKHMGWYLSFMNTRPDKPLDTAHIRTEFNQLATAGEQRQAIEQLHETILEGDLAA